MYTDALQGAIMIFGMAVLVIFTFTVLGGITEANQSLTDMADMVPASLQAIGHQGWTSMPAFGWGSTTYDMWWTVVTAIILGVGIGVLAQPQLVVRFMTVRSRRELDRAVPIGAVFILLMTGVPFTVGSLSNAWFAQHGTPLHGQVIEILNEDKDRALVELMRPTPQGGWETVISATTGQPASAPLQIAERQIATDANGEVFELVSGRAPAIVYARGEPDKIIPTYITEALPRWFGVLFFMTLLSAGMSTLSSQFHTMGTSAGRDLYERLSGKPSGSQPSLLVMRLAIVLGLIVAVTISYNIREDYVIARFTAIFFGLCAASFLPAYVAGLFFRRVTRTAALASMFVGAITSLFWLAFIKAREAGAIGLVQRFTDGKTSLLADYPNWPSVDPVLVALPLSALTLILVTAVTRPPETSHLDRCFPERAKR